MDLLDFKKRMSDRLQFYGDSSEETGHECDFKGPRFDLSEEVRINLYTKVPGIL